MIIIPRGKLDERQNLLFTLSLFTIMMSMMGVRLAVAYRIAAYFNMFMPILMSNLMINRKSHKGAILGVSIVIIIIYIVTGMPPGLDDYKFYWEITFLDYENNM